ncbi:HlyD family efflux transporter periplasmic adaptor subunit [Alphaproteobacteria bacterium KMM 3653]|uniref:HlyD family efflux transporter periplasmic adaptor subunit n=1 Tax=Harenicola maris TaxID=2841044 RepID=A0AAP2CQI8_9RHOB|nr:HlyD family efflux transporter periplasmic adaptor subunit [Harenicola maris]
MRFLRRSLVGLFLMALTLGLFAVAADMFNSAYQDRLNREARVRPAREQVSAVNVVVVRPETVRPEMTVFGQVLSRRTLDLRAPAGGRILSLAESFEEGGAVTAGTVLARLDPTDARAALDVARTDQLEAEAELRDAQRAVILAQDELTAARAQSELREAALRRQRDLQSRGVGTEAAIEAAALALSAADQAVLSRRQSLAQAETRVDQANNRLARQAVALANAQRDIEDTVITAAFDGILAEVSVVAGGIVAQNERIAGLVDPEALEVSFRVSTAQYARLLDADGRLVTAPVTVELDVLGLGLEASGQLARVSAAVGEGQTGRLIFARLDSFAGFRPGDFVTVRIDEPPLEGVARVPATAVDAGQTVLVVGEDERLEVAEVEIMRQQGDDVLIRAPGLEGKQIVAERSPLVGPGIRVRVLTPAGEAQAAAPDAAPKPERQGPELVDLSPERRAKLIALVEGSEGMPSEAKQRFLAQLGKDRVPARMIERIEARAGG